MQIEGAKGGAKIRERLSPFHDLEVRRQGPLAEDGCLEIYDFAATGADRRMFIQDLRLAPAIRLFRACRPRQDDLLRPLARALAVLAAQMKQYDGRNQN